MTGNRSAAASMRTRRIIDIKRLRSVIPRLKGTMCAPQWESLSSRTFTARARENITNKLACLGVWAVCWPILPFVSERGGQSFEYYPNWWLESSQGQSVLLSSHRPPSVILERWNSCCRLSPSAKLLPDSSTSSLLTFPTREMTLNQSLWGVTLERLATSHSEHETLLRVHPKSREWDLL